MLYLISRFEQKISACTDESEASATVRGLSSHRSVGDGELKQGRKQVRTDWTRSEVQICLAETLPEATGTAEKRCSDCETAVPLRQWHWKYFPADRGQPKNCHLDSPYFVGSDALFDSDSDSAGRATNLEICMKAFLTALPGASVGLHPQSSSKPHLNNNSPH